MAGNPIFGASSLHHYSPEIYMKKERVFRPKLKQFLLVCGLFWALGAPVFAGALKFVDQTKLENGTMLCGPSSAANAVIYLSEKHGFKLPKKLDNQKSLVNFFIKCAEAYNYDIKPYDGIPSESLYKVLNMCLPKIDKGLVVQHKAFTYGYGQYSEVYRTILSGGVSILEYNRYNPKNLEKMISGHHILAFDIEVPRMSERSKYSFVIKAVDPWGGAIRDFPAFNFSPASFDNSEQGYFIVENKNYNPSTKMVVLDSAILINYAPDSIIYRATHLIKEYTNNF